MKSNTTNLVIACVTGAVITLSALGFAADANDDSNRRRNECADIVTQNLGPGSFSASDIQAVAREVCR